jgi:hypothetical protein
MTDNPNKAEIGRRGFLGAFAGVTSAAVVAVVGSGAVSPAVAQESDDEKTKARYQESDHVQAFYRTNRY